jgi:hypothetical protein
MLAGNAEEFGASSADEGKVIKVDGCERRIRIECE